MQATFHWSLYLRFTTNTMGSVLPHHRAHEKLCLLMFAKHFKIRESRVCKTIKDTALPLLFDHSSGEIGFKNA